MRLYPMTTLARRVRSVGKRVKGSDVGASWDVSSQLAIGKVAGRDASEPECSTETIVGDAYPVS